MKAKIILIILFLNNTVFAQVTNVSSGVWSNPAIWSNNLLPVDTTDIILYFDLVIDINSSCRSLQSNGHNVTINPGVIFNITGVADSTVDVDGNLYPVVLIGTQRWMAKNLDVSHYRNGDTIPQVEDNAAWGNLTTGAWCYYEHSTAYGVEYGKLYNWYAVNDPRGLAPVGWRVSSNLDWGVFAGFLDDPVLDIQAGGKIKEEGLVHWDPPNAGDNNAGFTGLPGGYRGFSECFTEGYMAWWWCSDPDGANGASSVDVYNQSYYLEYNGSEKSYGFSVRCVKN
ncbi:MAG: fibrobacter succinogenes major paralogous domain-containing protein [Ferruginibacter sp.]